MKPTTTEIQRAFIVRYLSPDQIEQIRAVEASFKPLECLQACQMLAALEVQARTEVAPEEVAAMETLYLHFCKTILWKQQQIENDRHPKGCSMLSCYHPWNPLDKTRAQEIHQWEDYSLRHYKAPQVAGRDLAESLA